MAIKRLKIKVFGRVQGVFFRHSTRREAEELGLSGFVRNEPDGSVYLEAEGEEEQIQKFLGWCRKGPLLAKVEKIDFEFIESSARTAKSWRSSGKSEKFEIQ